jgi:hypothetical protein
MLLSLSAVYDSVLSFRHTHATALAVQQSTSVRYAAPQNDCRVGTQMQGLVLSTCLCNGPMVHRVQMKLRALDLCMSVFTFLTTPADAKAAGDHLQLLAFMPTVFCCSQLHVIPFT